MKYLFFVMMTTLITGCVSNKKVYNKSGIDSSKLATITTQKSNFFSAWGGGQFHTDIAGIYTDKGKKIIKCCSKLYGKVDLEPGMYTVVAKCHNGMAYAYPELSVYLEPSKKYSLGCDKNAYRAVYGSGYATVKIKEIEKAIEQKKQ